MDKSAILNNKYKGKMDNYLVCLNQDCQFIRLQGEIRETRQHFGHKVMSILEIQNLIRTSENHQGIAQRIVEKSTVINRI